MTTPLLEAPQAFEFFQAVRLLERRLQADGESRGGISPVSERIRFRNSLSLSFPPSQIEALEPLPDEDGSESGRFELTPSFMGLLGLAGVLPVHYTERLAAHEQQHRDDAPRAFLDIFSNRLVGLFYQAWKKHRLPLQYESNPRDGFIGPVLSLAGLGFAALRDRLGNGEDGIDDESVAHLSGLLIQRPLSASALQTLIATYFGVPVRIEQFAGHWYVLEHAQRSHLGVGNCVLGQSALCGARVWQRDLRIVIHIGPLDRAAYARFLPQGRSTAALGRLLGLASAGPLEYEIRPSLRAAEVAPLRLTANASARLGHDSFLCSRAGLLDRDDAAFVLDPAH